MSEVLRVRDTQTEDAHPQAQKLYQKPVPGNIGVSAKCHFYWEKGWWWQGEVAMMRGEAGAEF